MSTPHLRTAAACRAGCAGPARSRRRGLALPIVLLLIAMMLVTSSAWLESALFDARNAGALADYLRSYHAADSALRLCARAVVAGPADAPPMPATPGEPSAWQRPAEFDARATMPVDAWPGSVRPPQCMIEGWQLEDRPDARAWLLTARGFGASADAQTWLQLQLVLDGDAIESHWRRVAARPF